MQPRSEPSLRREARAPVRKLRALRVVQSSETIRYQRLARPSGELCAHYDAIVIGSGYGGSIAAYHLAREGRRVCLLERGTERLPGEYPENERELISQTRVQGKGFAVGAESALFDVRIGESIHVVQGSGLGGTSQINAGVAMMPDASVFEDARWPRALRDPRVLAPYYARARKMLGVQDMRQDAALPEKTRAHLAAAERMGLRGELVPLTVRFSAGRNAAGVEQAACNHCGDCCSGCNRGSKTTTWLSYLSLAARHGAQIFTELKVGHVTRNERGYSVHIEAVGQARRVLGANLTLSADVVVLAAGSLGSSEILLRSQERGLSVSSALGTRFSGNGDMLAFAHERTVTHEEQARGPCITASIACPGEAADGSSVLQEGAIPAAGARVMARVLPFLGAADAGVPVAERRKRLLRALIEGTRLGAANARTHTLLLVGHDAASGQLRLENDRLSVHAPLGVDEGEARRKQALMRRAAQALGGEFVDNPATEGLGHAMVTVHPLGGCVMADRAEQGVVNDRGQVFSSSHGQAVHEGLYVCDGAIVPSSLGVNPLLTISALSERIAERMVLDTYATETNVALSVAVAPGVRFEETLRGELELLAGGPWQTSTGARSGKAVLALSVRIELLERFLGDARHEARVIGSLDVAGVGALCIERGSLQLFAAEGVASPERVGLAYDLAARATDGTPYHVRGRKLFVDGPLRALRDSTTLHVEIVSESDQQPVARGILRIGAKDLARLMASLEVTGAADAELARRTLARFVSFFVGELHHTYRPRALAVRADESRKLRAPKGERHPIIAADGAELLLTRHAGGKRGPVLLAPGFAMSADCFALPTVQENLVEYLTEREYDVWSFDYRSSPRLSAAARPYTLDDVATLDWPAAVAHVLRESDAPSLQAVAHCAGSMTLLMALLSGMEGVRSVVSGQLTIHPVSCFANRFKAAVRLPNLLSSLGVRVLPAVSDAEALLSRTHPAQVTDVDHFRLRALFGPTFYRPRVNERTRALLPRYFGALAVHPFEHFSRIIRQGHVLDHRGRDTYLPKLSRLALPMLFLAGAHNRLFLPETSHRTWSVLRARHEPTLFERQVFADYAHLDCFVGDDAARDIFPVIESHLERHDG